MLNALQQPNTARICAEINLDHLVFNLNLIKDLTTGKMVMAIIKADAYGHGAVPVARALRNAGVDYLGVATAEEALQLRHADITCPILILGYVRDDLVPVLSKAHVSLTVGSLETARRYNALAEKPLTVHIKIDTGMVRLGLPAMAAPHQAGEEILAIARLKNLYVEGLFSHLAAADDLAENLYTLDQIKGFKEVVSYIDSAGLAIPIKHCANSAGVLQYKEAHFDMVRPGILLYGVSPSPQLAGKAAGFKPVMALKTSIMRIADVDAGQSVSYGRIWKAPGPRRIATVGAGYADGLSRLNSGRMHMSVRGALVPQIGRICMDMCLIDVTDVPDACPGDPVTVFGISEGCFLPVDALAYPIGTIPYESLCAISKRVLRIYYKDGAETDRLTYL